MYYTSLSTLYIFEIFHNGKHITQKTPEEILIYSVRLKKRKKKKNMLNYK